MEKETTKLVIPETLNQIVLVSGLDKNRALGHAMRFVPFMQEITNLSQAYDSMDKENPTPSDVKTARENRLAIVKLRTGSEKIKKSLKEGVITEGKLLDALDNKIDSSASAIEAKYEAIEKHAENIEKERKEKLQKERLEMLKELTDKAHLYPLGEMQQDGFDELVNGLKLAKQAKELADQKAKEEAEAKVKAEAEEKEKLKAENERLAKEQEESKKVLEEQKAKADKEKSELEAKAKAEKEKSDKLAREAKIKADKILADQKAEADKKLKLEQEAKAKLEAELKAKADKEAKDKADADAKEKERLAAEKKAAKAPDKEKLKVFVNSFEIPSQASGLSSDSLIVESLIIEKFKAFKTWAEKQIEGM